MYEWIHPDLVRVAWGLAATVAAVAMMRRAVRLRLRLEIANKETREAIYRARHDVYVHEIQQYPPNPTRSISDPTDAYNTYIVARSGSTLCGFLAVTPPGRPKGMEKHGIVPMDPASFEIRLMTVVRAHRRCGIAAALCYGAARYIGANGGTRVEAMARLELVPVYSRFAFRVVDGKEVKVGKATYVHMHASVDEFLDSLPLPRMRWALPFGMFSWAPCHHGGAGLERLSISKDDINADVLDAWFPPAPAVIHALREDADVVNRTPPSKARELLDALEEHRGVPSNHFVLGAGSSDLIYRAFYTWLTPSSRVLLVVPTYAEYEHVLEEIGCDVTVVDTSANPRFCLRTEDLPLVPFDLAIVVHPNSPTGAVYDNVLDIVRRIDAQRVWVDETYVDYAGKEKSLENHLAGLPNVVVCKSMSKAYALSGARVGYLCAQPAMLDDVRRRTPPWIVGRMAQRAAVQALRSSNYYWARYQETHELRGELTRGLRVLGWEVVGEGCANFVLCRPPLSLCAEDVARECAAHRLFVRVVDDDHIRIAVRDADTLQRMIHILREVTQPWVLTGPAADLDPT